MPLGPGVRYRWKKMKSGKKVRLAFRGNEVIEAKSSSGKMHTSAEFARDKKRRAARRRIRKVRSAIAKTRR